MFIDLASYHRVGLEKVIHFFFCNIGCFMPKRATTTKARPPTTKRRTDPLELRLGSDLVDIIYKKLHRMKLKETLDKIQWCLFALPEVPSEFMVLENQRQGPHIFKVWRIYRTLSPLAWMLKGPSRG